MRTLFLGRSDSEVIPFLDAQGDLVHATEAPITVADLDGQQVEFVVSHGYRHMIRADVLARLPGKVINLHCSYLPYNRGADPNFWSIVENTPKGVTIHQVDEGLDTGAILLQAELEFGDDDTLRTSYNKLQQALISLFQMHWESLKAETIAPVPQTGPTTYHRLRDRELWLSLLTDGYDTSIAQLQAAWHDRKQPK